MDLAAVHPLVPAKSAGLLVPAAGRVHSVKKDDLREAMSAGDIRNPGPFPSGGAESHHSQVWVIQEPGFP